MHYKITHITKVKYDGMVRLARFNLRLKPAFWASQSISDYQLEISPKTEQLNPINAAYPVNITRLEINAPLQELIIKSSFKAIINAPIYGDNEKSENISQIRRRIIDQCNLDKMSPAHYIYGGNYTKQNQEIANWALSFIDADEEVFIAARKITSLIYQEFKYDSKATKTDTPAIESFRNRHGVCQDFAHIMIIALRALGIPAAYVSGYLRTIPPAGKPRLIGADATHAWVNVWCGMEMGWVGFDPTNNCIVKNDHIFTAMGRDYGDVAPVDGVFVGYARQKLDVSVDVEPLLQTAVINA